MSVSETGVRKPSVLIVYYTYTQQALKVAEAMADRFRERGCDVKLAKIELTDKRWAERFTRFPLKHAYGDVLGMFGAQMRGAIGDIQIPEEAQAGDHDLVVIGSPTWFFKPSVPIRSYLKSKEAGNLLDGTPFAIYVVCRRYWSINMKAVKKLATKRGGKYVGNLHFVYAGKQIRSFLAMMSNFKHGENRNRYLGVKIPPTNLQVGYHEQAHVFADELVDQLESTRGQQKNQSSPKGEHAGRAPLVEQTDPQV
jgi:menaquinone-dependent protoporphyrinogen IX oxidase